MAKTQKQYWSEIQEIFWRDISMNPSAMDALKKYAYDDARAADVIHNFKESIKALGLELSSCYHAGGIGNNNEYQIFVKEVDKDGFLIEKKVARLYYCYGIYGGCYIQIKDLVDGDTEIAGHAR